MIYIKPWFYDSFRCISSKCTDNCCIGWEIDVDDETLSKYNQVKGDFGKRIAQMTEALAFDFAKMKDVHF